MYKNFYYFGGSADVYVVLNARMSMRDFRVQHDCVLCAERASKRTRSMNEKIQKERTSWLTTADTTR